MGGGEVSLSEDWLWRERGKGRGLDGKIRETRRKGTDDTDKAKDESKDEGKDKDTDKDTVEDEIFEDDEEEEDEDDENKMKENEKEKEKDEEKKEEDEEEDKGKEEELHRARWLARIDRAAFFGTIGDGGLHDTDTTHRLARAVVMALAVLHPDLVTANWTLCRGTVTGKRPPPLSA